MLVAKGLRRTGPSVGVHVAGNPIGVNGEVGSAAPSGSLAKYLYVSQLAYPTRMTSMQAVTDKNAVMIFCVLDKY